MKIQLPAVLLVLACGAGLATSSFGLADDESSVDAPAADAFHPGAEHRWLQQLEGTWDAVLIAHDPTGAEQRTRGVLTTTRHTDFHTVDSFQGEFMGMPMIGHGVNSYCTARRQYVAFWTDSMTSSPMTLTGEYDATTRELSLKGECYGMSGGLEPCRTVTRFDDADHHSWTLFGRGPAGQEMQLLRIEYTRR